MTRTHICPLSLHDALPIFNSSLRHGSFAAFWLHNNKGRLTRGCNPTSSKFIHTWLRFGEIMRGSLSAALYFSFEEKCRDFNLSKEQKAELVLNALVAIRYLKPQMPKSWHFVSHGEMWVPMPGDAACVWLSDTHEQVNLLVVESGENAALCL